MAPKKSLFEDDDDPTTNGNNNSNKNAFRVNPAYAKKFQTIKMQQDMQRMKELQAELDDDESDVEEDETGELLTPQLDKKLIQTFAKIKTKSNDIYDTETKFFDEENSDQPTTASQSKQQSKKPFTLHEYEKKMMLEQGPEFFGQSDSDNEEAVRPVETHDEEQRRLKKAFLESAEETIPDTTDFFTVKNKTRDTLQKENEDYEKFLLEQGSKKKGKSNQTGDELVALKRYYEDPNLNQDEKFLLQYVLKRGWIEKDESEIVADIGLHDDTDDEDDLAVDDYERTYNFRHEQGEDQIVGYPRQIDNSVRRKETTRSKARERKAEQKSVVRSQMEQELNRLKNVKRKEIMKQLGKIEEISGVSHDKIEALNLDDDFDPETFDAQMEQLFNDDYYDQDEDQKPELGDEDQWVDEPEPQTQSFTHNTTEDMEDPDFNMDADYDETADAEPSSRPAMSKAEQKKLKKKLKRGELDDAEIDRLSKELPKDSKLRAMLEEYQKMGFEGVAGDMATRFKYKQVEGSGFGLDPVELLLADDSELNSYVPLKKLAPYRPERIQKKDVKKLTRKTGLARVRQSLQPVMDALPAREKELNSRKRPRALDEAIAAAPDKKKKKKTHKLMQ